MKKYEICSCRHPFPCFNKRLNTSSKSSKRSGHNGMPCIFIMASRISPEHRVQLSLSEADRLYNTTETRLQNSELLYPAPPTEAAAICEDMSRSWSREHSINNWIPSLSVHWMKQRLSKTSQKCTRILQLLNVFWASSTFMFSNCIKTAQQIKISLLSLTLLDIKLLLLGSSHTKGIERGTTDRPELLTKTKSFTSAGSWLTLFTCASCYPPCISLPLSLNLQQLHRQQYKHPHCTNRVGIAAQTLHRSVSFGLICFT